VLAGGLELIEQRPRRIPSGPQGSTGEEEVGVGVGDEEDPGLEVAGGDEDEVWPRSGVVDGGEVDGGGSVVDGGFDELVGGVDVPGDEGSTHTPPTTTPSGQSSVGVGVGVSDVEAGGLEGVGVVC
jgi:hypothetical protein